MLGVNPFDQPGVEAYKKNMYALLGKPGYEEMAARLKALLGEKATEIAGRCGEGYASDTYMTPGRAIASVFAESKEAIKDNLDNNTILRNLS